MEKVLKISLDSSQVKAELDALRAPTDRASEAFERMVKEAKELGKKLGESLGGGSRKAVSDMQEAFARMQEKTRQLQENFSSAFGGMRKAATDAATQTSSSFTSMEKAGDSLIKKLAGLTGALAGGFGFTALLKSAGEFEKQMNTVAAISGLNLDVGKDIETLNELTAAARQAGATTQFTALEAGKALEFEAASGYSVKQSIEGLIPIINASVSTNTDLATTASIVTDTLSAFEQPVSNMTHSIDMAAKTTVMFSTNFTQLGEGAKYAAPAFHEANQSMATMNATLGLMAQSGMKASMGGTSATHAISSLLNPSHMAAKLMGKLGFTIADESGRFKDLVSISEELVVKLKGFTEVDKASFLFKVFGIEGARTMSTLMKQSILFRDEQGKMTSRLRVMRDTIEQADGTTQIMANTMGKGLIPALAISGSALEEFGLKATEQLLPAATKLVVAFSNAVTAITPMAGILMPLVEIVGVGGGLVLGFTALTKSVALVTVAKTALLATVNTSTASVMLASGGWAKLTTSLYGTSVAAQVAGSSMAKLQLAGQVAFAAFAGWEIGSYFYKEFSSVRDYSYEFIGKMEEHFLSIQYYTQVTTTLFRGGFQEAIDFVSDIFATGFAAAQQSILSIQSAFPIVAGAGQKIIGDMVGWIMDKFAAMVSGLAGAMSYADFIPGVEQASSGLNSLSESIKSSSESMKSMGVVASESLNATVDAYSKQSEAITKNKEAIQSSGGSQLKEELNKLSTEFEKNKQNIRENVNELQSFNDAKNSATKATLASTDAKKAEVKEDEEITRSLQVLKNEDKLAREAKRQAAKEEREAKKIAREQESAARKAQTAENKQAKTEIDGLKDALNEQAKQIDGTAKSYREAAKALSEQVNELKKYHSSLTEAQTALVTSGMTEYEKELYTGVKELGAEYGVQVAIVKNLAKAQSELVSIQLEQKKVSVKADMQALRGQGVSQEDIDREVKYKQLRIDLSQKYTKVVAEELVQQQRFLDASKEQIETQKKVVDSQQLVNESTLNDRQREYVKLMREVGVENAKQIIQNQELAAARSKGASTLASLQEEHKLLQMTSEEQKRYNAIKDAAPEQRDAIVQQMELNEAIKASKARLDEAGKIAGGFFEKFASGSMSGKEALKAMAGEISAFASKELFTAARDQLQGLARKKSNAELVGNVVDENLAKATKWFDENTSKVVNKSQDFSGTIAKAVDEAGKKLGTSIDGFAKQINDAIVQQKSYEQQADVLEKAAQAMKDSANQIRDATKDIGQGDNSITASEFGSTTKYSNTSVDLGVGKKSSYSKDDVVKIVASTADKYNISRADFLKFTHIETGGKFNPNAFNQGSKAAGLFQFIPSTAAKYGLRGQEFDPFANANAGAKLYLDNLKAVQKTLSRVGQSRGVTGADMYLAHQQGAAGYSSTLSAAAGRGFTRSDTVRNIKANVAASDLQKFTGVSYSQFMAMGQSNAQAFASTFVKYWNNKFNAIKIPTLDGKALVSPISKEISKGGSDIKQSMKEVDSAVKEVQKPAREVSSTSKILSDTQSQAANAQKEMATKIQAIQQQKVEVDQKDLISSSAHNEAMAAVEAQRQNATIEDTKVIVVHAQATEQGAAAIANVAAMNPGIVAQPQGGLGGLTSAISGVFQKGVFEQGGLLGGASSLFGLDKIQSIADGGGLGSIFSGDLGNISQSIGGIAGSLGGTQALGIGMNILSGEFENAAVDAAALAASMTPLGPLGGAAVKAFASFAGVGAEWVKEAEWITVDIKGLSATFQKGIRETKDSMISGGTRTSYSDVSKEELEKLNEQFSTIRDSVEQLNDSLSGLDINLMKGMGDYQAHIEDREGLGAEVFAKSMEEAQKQMLTHAIENMQIAGVDNDATKSLQENVTAQVSGRVSDLMGLFTDINSKIDYDMAVADSTWNGDLDRILGQNEVNSKEYHEKLTTGLLDYVQTLDLGNMNVDEIQADLAQKTQAMFADIGVHDIPQSTFDSLSKTLATRINDAILFVQTGVSEFAVSEDTGFFSTLRSMTQTFDGSAEELKRFIDSMVTLKGTFKESGLSTNSITETFIDAAGGLEKLSASTSKFKDKFVSETEAQSLAVQDSLGGVNKAIASTGVILPQTREGFADLVRGLSSAGADSEEALAKLIGTSDKFDIFYTAVEDFNQKFLKLPESFKPIGSSVDSVITELNKLGVSVPKTRQEFTNLVTGLDVTDAAQSKLYTSLVSISPAVDTVFSSIESLGGGLLESEARFTAYSTSLTDVTQLFSDLGVTVPNSANEFNSLIQSIDLTTESGQNLYSSLMSATPALNQLYNAAKQIVGVDVSSVSGALQKGIDAGSQGGDSGATFYSSFIEDIQSKFLSSTLDSVSTIIMDSVVTPMINASVQSATNMQLGSANAGNNLAVAGAGTANNLAQAGGIASTDIANSGSYASQQMATGGNSASQAMIIGGRLSGEALATAVETVKQVMLINSQVMEAIKNDAEFQAQMTEIGNAAFASSSAFIPVPTQSFQTERPSTQSNEQPSEATKDSVDSVDEAKDAFDSLQVSLTDLMTGLEGNDLKLKNLGEKYKNLGFIQDFVGNSSQELSKKVSAISFEQMTTGLDGTDISVKDLSADMQEYIGILQDQEKAEKDRQESIGKYNQDLSEQIATMQLSEKELKTYNENKEYQKIIDDTVAAGGDLAVAEQINALKKKKATEEQLKAINDFEKQYRDQIQNIGKSSQQLELDKLATEFESALNQANELGADTVVVTEAFEQQRADIIKKYTDENSEAIKSLQNNIIDMSSFKNATKESQSVATAKNYGVDLGQIVVGSDIQGIIDDAVNYSEEQWVGLMQSVGVAIDATNIAKFKDDLSGVASVALQLQSQFWALQNSLELITGASDEPTQKLMALAKQFPGIGIAVDGNTVAIQGMVMTSEQAANDLLNVMENPAEFAKLASKVGIESQEDFMNAASSIIGVMKEMDAKADATEATMKGLHEAMEDIRDPIDGAQKTLKDLDREFGGFVTSSDLFGKSAIDVANAVDSIPIDTLTGVSMQFGLSLDQVTAKVISGVQALNQIQGQVTTFQQQQQDAVKVASGISQHELVLDELKNKYKEFPEIIAAISKEGLTSLDVQKFVGDISNPTDAIAGLSETSGYSIQSILDDVTKLEGALDGINGQATEVSNATTDLKNSLKVMAGETNSTALSLDGFKNKYPDLIKTLGLGGASVETLNLKLGGLSDKQFEKYADKAGVATTELIADMKSFSENTKTLGDQTAERTAKIAGFIGDMDRTSSTLDDVEYSMKKLGQTSPELVTYLQTLGKNSYEISASLATMDTSQVDNLTKIAEGMGYSLDRAIEESKTYIGNLRSQEEKKSEAEKATLEEQQKRDQDALESAKKAQEEQQAAMEKANEERQKAAQEQQAAMEKAAQEQQAAYEKQQDELMKQVDGLFSVFDKLADKVASVAEGLAASIKSFYSEDQLKLLDQAKLSSLRSDIFKPRTVVDVTNPDSTEKLLDNIDEYQKLMVASRKDEIANIEKARDEAQAAYNDESAYRQKLHESSLQITSDINQNIGEITKALGQADSAVTTRQNLLDSFANESNFEKKLEIAKQIPSAIKAAMDEEIALDEKRIESAKAAREAQEKLNESIRKGLSSSAGIREKIVGGQDPIAKFQSLMAKISPDMVASEENIQLIQDAQNAAYESYQAQIDSQKKLEDDRFNSAKKHIEDERKGIDELKKQSESFLKSVEDLRRQGKTDTRVFELEQAGFQELLAKYKAGDTSSSTLDALRAAGTSYVQQGEKVYGSAKEQTGTGGIIEQVSSAFQEIGLSLGQQANQKEAILPIDETVTGTNVTAIKEIQSAFGAQTLEQLAGLDAILNSMFVEPSPLPESQVEAIRTGASEQLTALNEQMLLLTEQLSPENQPKFDDSEFAAKISETQNATVAELQSLAQMTVQLDTELKNSLALSLSGIYDRLSPENQGVVAARLETAIQRDITAPLRELGITFSAAIGSLGLTISKIQADAKNQIAVAAAAADAKAQGDATAKAKTVSAVEQQSRNTLPATTRDPPLIIDKATGKIVPLGAPRMAEGGIVTKPTYAYIGEGDESEAVIPLSKLPGLVQNINLQQANSSEVKELVQMLATITKNGNNAQSAELLVKILDAIKQLNVETKSGFKAQQRAIEERKVK